MALTTWPAQEWYQEVVDCEYQLSAEALGLVEDAVYDGLKTLALAVNPEEWAQLKTPLGALLGLAEVKESAGQVTLHESGAVVFDLLEVWKTKGRKLSAAHRKKISDALKARAALKAKAQPVQAPKVHDPNKAAKKAALAAKKAAMPGTAEMAAKHPLGSKIKTKHGELTVTGHSKGYVLASGGPQKMYKHDQISAVGVATTIVHKAPTTGLDLGIGKTHPKGMTALKAEYPTGTKVKTPHGEYEVIGHNSTHVVVKGAPQKMYPAAKLSKPQVPDSAGLSASSPAPVHKAGDWPTDPHKLTVKGGLGGSTGAKLVEGPDGKQYVFKTGKDKGHIAAEAGANSVYEAAGVTVPKHRHYEKDGVQLTEYIAGGKTLDKVTGPELDAVHKQLGKHFVLDAVLGNRDVVGPDKANVLVKDGVAYRIDNGASFDYRAQGGKKEFTASVGELKSMRDAAINPATASVYKHLTADDLRQQALDLHANRDKILAATPEKYRDIVSARIDDVVKQTGAVPAKAPVAAGPAKAVGAGDTSHIPAGHPLHGKKIGDPADPSGDGSESMVKGKKLGDHVGEDVDGKPLHIGDKIIKNGDTAIVTGVNNHNKVKGLYDDDVAAGEPHHLLMTGAKLTKSVHGADGPSAATAPAQKVQALHSSKDIAKAHPPGSKIHLPDGTELTVTKPYTGYVYVDGGKQKMYKLSQLAAMGATHGPAASAGSAPAHIPTGPVAGPVPVSKWTGKQPGAMTDSSKNNYQYQSSVAQKLSTATGMYVPVDHYAHPHVTDPLAKPPGTGKSKQIHGSLVKEGWEHAGKNYEGKHVYGHEELGSVIVGKTGKVAYVPTKTPYQSYHGQSVVKADGQPNVTKDGHEVKVGDTVYNSYGEAMKVVGQAAGGQVLVQVEGWNGKPATYANTEHWLKNTATLNPPAGYTAPTPVGATPKLDTGSTYTAPKSSAVSQNHKPDKAPGSPPVGIPDAHTGPNGTAPTPIKGDDAIAAAHKAVPPAPGNTSAGSTPKYDQAHPPKVGQAVYNPVSGENAVVTHVQGSTVYLKKANGLEGTASLLPVAKSGENTHLKPYDPAKASGSTGGIGPGYGGATNGSASVFTPQTGWPTKFGAGQTTLKNSAWIAQQHAHVESMSATEKASLKAYTGSTYAAMNNHLRHREHASDSVKKQIALINKAMEVSRADHDFVVYRGIGNDSKTKLPVDIQVGQVFRDKGFMSTSLDKNGAFGGNTQMEILIPKGGRGVYAKAVSNFKGENEFLLGSGSQFIVHEVVMKGGIRYVRMELIVRDAPGAEKLLLEALRSFKQVDIDTSEAA